MGEMKVREKKTKRRLAHDRRICSNRRYHHRTRSPHKRSIRAHVRACEKSRRRLGQHQPPPSHVVPMLPFPCGLH
jgi:hypothetical protein